jgi:hypothetical protein
MVGFRVVGTAIGREVLGFSLRTGCIEGVVPENDGTFGKGAPVELEGPDSGCTIDGLLVTAAGIGAPIGLVDTFSTMYEMVVLLAKEHTKLSV